MRPTDESGMIMPGKLSAIFGVLGGIACTSGGIAILLFDPHPHATLFQQIMNVWLVVFGVCATGFMLPSLTSIHQISWDKEGVTGPSKTFGLTLGTSRATIAWLDVAGVGETMMQFRFISAADGRRIYWTSLFVDHRVLEDAIVSRCPNIRL